ncbi:P-loop containing nucleoside triphosphate hydrolase protein [Penicillium verhagenii]|uniref:P-loop containing nucleoside triphosphate hydrolase protein n=1 Tax=Penicillium verhagenii TaxID=1562060 RepID=UPI002545A27B|nr:P-loop containing nucleoside triphosphate hydrolase protein [Penicillium verhagenii]KAJ5947740.1 P-loop containing nucleoside triphosphate hydrolase protein [Penicillium verhagenii]
MSSAETFVPEYLKGEMYGADTPADLSRYLLEWHAGHITIAEKTIKGKIRLTLDTQEPRVEFTPFENHAHGQIIFTAAKTTPSIQLFNQQDLGSSPNLAFFEQHASIMDSIELNLEKCDLLAFEFKTHETPPMPASEREPPADKNAWEIWKFLNDLPWTDQIVLLWLQLDAKHHDKITRIKNSYTSAMDVVKSEGSHWYLKKVELAPGKARRPARPWSFNPDGKHRDKYGDILCRDSFFIDSADYQAHLLEGTRNDCHIQESAIKDVFHIGVQHLCRFERIIPRVWNVFVRIRANVKPVLSELTRVRFDNPQSGAVEKSLRYDGQIVDCQSNSKGDITILSMSNIPSHFHNKEMPMDLMVGANVAPAHDQMKYLEDAWKIKVVGDQPSGWQKGFSLHKTLLAHGREMDTCNPGYFQLNMMQSNQLSASEVDTRIQRILDLAKLDQCQLDAFRASTSRIPGGLQLIQGPPGTGKTKTATSIILAHALVGHKVLLTAGSNKAVENLTNGVFKVIKSNVDIEKLVGDIVRFRTPAYCMSVIRNKSKNTNPIARVSELSSTEKELDSCQLYTLVQRFAENNPDDPYCKAFNECSALDIEEGLNSNAASILKNSMEFIMGKILRLAKTNIVASTFGSIAQDLIRLNFHPDVLVSDESGQCLEAEHVIGMSLESLKAVILIGDPDQLAPTVMTGGDHNEYAGYLKRPLMTRLKAAGYPLALLRTNYRCHSDILRFFNEAVYKGKLVASAGNDVAERVSNVWSDFTASHAFFRRANVDGRRRLVINSPGYAEKDGVSFKNPAQAELLSQVLRELYAFKAASSERITPADVLIISPYKAQRDCIKATLSKHNIQYRENLTIDAAQGQEAPIVFLLLTKPGPDNRKVGFVADPQRLNVALSRAQRVLVIITNLDSWDVKAATRMSMKPETKMLASLLLDVNRRRHVLSWSGPTLTI